MAIESRIIREEITADETLEARDRRDSYAEVNSYLAERDLDSPRFIAVADYAQQLEVATERDIMLYQLKVQPPQSDPDIITAQQKRIQDQETRFSEITEQIKTNEAIPGYSAELAAFKERFTRRLTAVEEPFVQHHDVNQIQPILVQNAISLALRRIIRTHQAVIAPAQAA